ncbi:hypothetical protein CK203_115451 [Vitis vinifera]|uniref:Retrotransposon gag domain-containing protein n=1 Tax=Vitis vinifera TaxID=29760 RepID=A0A438BL81_VITVI|nr:hypothetical protein CK203_115451 [Vitis vinifera]
MRRLKHTGSKRDYVKEFSSLMLEIPNMTKEELLFNFRDSLGNSSNVESLEDSHATSGGDEVSRDHNAPRMGSGKMPNVQEGRGKLGTYECLEKVLKTHRDVSKRGNDEDVDGIEPRKLLETLGAIYTKSLERRVWKVLEMPRDVHTSLHYGGRHERSPRLSGEF